MTYKPANTRAAWYQDDYPGAAIDPNVVVLHTTEGLSLPSYSGGATAPNVTAVPDLKAKRLNWFAHFPDNRSSRALRNEAGGVETNTSNAHQIELVGTCAPGIRDAWRRAGRTQFIYWPDAPDWALEDLAEYLADFHLRHGVPLVGPPRGFLPYPASYGQSKARLTGAEWNRFHGVLGHQNVPENSHGDPGALDLQRVLGLARDLATPDKPSPANDGPLVIDLSIVRGAFLRAVQGKPDGPRKHVRRVQMALNARYGTALRLDGVVGQQTLNAWGKHEADTDGEGRPRVPDATSLATLVAPRFTMVK